MERSTEINKSKTQHVIVERLNFIGASFDLHLGPAFPELDTSDVDCPVLPLVLRVAKPWQEMLEILYRLLFGRDDGAKVHPDSPSSGVNTLSVLFYLSRHIVIQKRPFSQDSLAPLLL